MTFTREEILVIMSEEHRYYTEKALGRRATDLDLIEHFIQNCKIKIHEFHTHEDPTLWEQANDGD